MQSSVVDWLMCVCRWHWCQTLFRQCFHNECICVCWACKTALKGIAAACLGFCICFLWCRLWASVYGALVFSRSLVPVYCLHMRNWMSSSVTEHCTLIKLRVCQAMFIFTAYCHCWPCCLYRRLIKLCYGADTLSWLSKNILTLAPSNSARDNKKWDGSVRET